MFAKNGKKAARKKLTVAKVQEAVNKAIRERDCVCVVRDGRHECCGNLTASHFFSVGGNGAFRFYPPNIHAQCFGHHGIHERGQNPFFYRAWMEKNRGVELDWMQENYWAIIKYDQVTLSEILEMAKKRDLYGLTIYIQDKINASKT